MRPTQRPTIVSKVLLVVLLFGVETLHRYGYLIAFPLPQEWRGMYEKFVLFAGTSPRNFFYRGGFLREWRPSVLLFGAVLALCIAPLRRGVRAIGLLFVLLVVVFEFRSYAHLQFLIPGAVLVVVIEVVLYWRRKWAFDRGQLDRLCIAVAALPALSRQPFFLHNMIYGAFSASEAAH